MSQWRAGGRCPIEDCTFEFYIGSDDESELDLVAQAAFQRHADISHEGVPTNLLSFRQTSDGDDTEERPRLLN